MGSTDTCHGRFVELVPGALVVEAVWFETEREDLRGVMTIRTSLTPAGGETALEIGHAGLPAGLNGAENRRGTEMAPAKLGALLEPGVAAG